MYISKWTVNDLCWIYFIPDRLLRSYTSWCPKNGLKGARYNVTLSGSIKETVFYDWLDRHFIPAVIDISRPIFLLFDEHWWHISVRITNLAIKHGIHLECLPTHSTTVLQPLDLAISTRVKTAWRIILRTHNRKTNFTSIDHGRFALLVGNASLHETVYIMILKCLFRSKNCLKNIS